MKKSKKIVRKGAKKTAKKRMTAAQARKDLLKRLEKVEAAAEAHLHAVMKHASRDQKLLKKVEQPLMNIAKRIENIKAHLKGGRR